jgi:formylglycine-generating enzyme required for sulfatase activity
MGRHSLDLNEQPVTNVSWDEAVEYCNWLSQQDNLPPAYEQKSGGYVLRKPVTIGYRLPTEAEWEYATKYASAGQFLRLAWGYSDMSGNVSEWVNDYYTSSVKDSQLTDPLGPDDGTLHVIRGANWKSSVATDLRSAWRDGAEGKTDTVGFRLARYGE